VTIPEGATTPDPVILDAAVAELELETPIEQAYVTPGGQLHIHTRYEAHVVPVAASGKTNTLPRSDVRAGSEGKADTLPNTEGSGLDDFTAIAGVGPKTAQKLHDLELYTYEDLRTWIELRQNEATSSQVELVEVLHGITAHTFEQIKEWLEARLV
jgi:predicted flap endonuclease-1-like 5' DNA nuclease